MEGTEKQIDWVTEAIQLESTPKQLRKETTREFCQRHSIPESNYYYHIRKTENKKRILEIVLNEAKERAPDILKKLADKAEEGDMRAMDIYVDSILQLAKNLDIKSDGKPIIQLANEIAQRNGLNTIAKTDRN